MYVTAAKQYAIVRRRLTATRILASCERMCSQLVVFAKDRSPLTRINLTTIMLDLVVYVLRAWASAVGVCRRLRTAETPMRLMRCYMFVLTLLPRRRTRATTGGLVVRVVGT